jgi:recombination protein RecA
MAKEKKEKDIVFENLAGFIRLGAVEKTENIPTGHFNLDFVIHYGTLPEMADISSILGYDPAKSLGLPLGKVVEFFGEEGGGKSSLAYRVIGNAQKLGYKVAWIDTENSFSEDLAEINGADSSNIYLSNLVNYEDENVTYAAEDVLDAIPKLCKSGVKVVVVDSVANLVPRVRMEADAEKMMIGTLAKLLTENLGKIVNYAAKYGVLVIMINQLREKPGTLWGDPETTPGGRSLKHNASLRIKVSKMNSKDAQILVKDENGKERLIGRYARVNIAKNRFGKPFFDSFPITTYYEKYCPNIEDIMFMTARNLQIITVRTGIFTWAGEDKKDPILKVEGQRAFIEALKEKNLQNKLFGDILKEATSTKCLLPPELIKWKEEHYNVGKEEAKPQETEENGTESAEQITEGLSSRGRKKKDSGVS